MARTTPQVDKARLARLIEKAGDLRAQVASIKADLEPIDAAIQRMMEVAKLDEAETGRFLASYIQPKRAVVDKEKVKALVSYEEFVALAEVSLKAVAASFTEDQRKDIITEKKGTPYIKIVPKGGEAAKGTDQ